MTTKLNKYSFAMRQKYGSDWDTPLFARHKEPAPPPVPDFINDATEEKAEVYSDLNQSAMMDEQRERVLGVIRELNQVTDNQVARILKIHPSTVAARRNELRDRGLVIPVLDDLGTKLKQRDPVTGIPNTLWKVNNA
jgi:hypothetical protein